MFLFENPLHPALEIKYSVYVHFGNRNPSSLRSSNNTGKKNYLRVEHCLVRNTLLKSENHNFFTRTSTVFAKRCFEIPKIIVLSISYNLLTMKILRNFKWCVMWVNQSLHMQNKRLPVLSFEKKISEFLYSLIPL